MFAKRLGIVLFALSIFTSSGFAGLNVSLMNFLRGCLSAIVSMVLVFFVNDVMVAFDEFALVV